MSRIRHGLLLAFACLVLGPGCSSDTPPAPTAEATPATGPVDDGRTLKPGVPQTPEAAVKVVLDGLKTGKPVAAWDALPDQVQHGLDELVGGLAGSADVDVWNQTVANLKKLATLVETKKEFILASPLWKTGQLPKLEDVKERWTPFAKLLRTIVDSEVIDQGKMKSFSGHKFLEGTGAKLYVDLRALAKTMHPDPLAMIDTAKVTVKKESDTSAKVIIERPDSKGKPFSLKLSIIDGRWSTSDFNLIVRFAPMMAQPYFVLFRPYQLIEWKSAYLKDMERLGKILDQLQNAKTSDEFQSVVGAQALPFTLQKMAQLRAPRPALTAIQQQGLDRGPNTTMVIIKDLHTIDEPTYRELTRVLRAASPDTFRGPIELDGMTLMFVGPGPGFAKVVPLIQVGKVVATDKVRDTVTVELPTSLPKESSTAEAHPAGKQK